MAMDTAGLLTDEVAAAVGMMDSDGVVLFGLRLKKKTVRLC